MKLASKPAALKSALKLSLLTTLVAASVASAYAADAKNVIFFLGDGMGPLRRDGSAHLQVQGRGQPEHGQAGTYGAHQDILERCANDGQRPIDGRLHDRRQDEQ